MAVGLPLAIHGLTVLINEWVGIGIPCREPVWPALYYAFGRRLLPIMVARWVFNAGSALAVAFNLVG